MKKPSLFLLLALALAACGQGGNERGGAVTASSAAPSDEAAVVDGSETASEAGAAASEAATAGTFNCGDQSKLGSSLAIFSWAEYWPDELLADFEAACGVHITVDTFPSNEDLAARLRAGNSGYDLVVPSDYMVQTLVAENRLAKLDKSLLPNIKNLDPAQMGLYYDAANDYSVPYLYGTTGIAYNAAEVDPAPDSWAALFDPSQLEAMNGRISMFDDERETVGAALKWRGYSVNSTDPGQLEEAKAALIAQKPFIARYDSESYQNGLASQELLLAQAWNGNTSLGKEENADIAFVIPKEGSVIWQDNLSIPVDAPNQYAAHVFIDNVLSPEIGAQITDFTYYLTPNKAAEPLIDPAVRELIFYPTAEERERLEYIERSGDPALYADIWTAVKAE